MKEERILAWHFLPANGKVSRLDIKPIKGRILKHDGPISICNTGLHASIKAIDALYYAPGPIITKVELWGGVQSQSDKICGRFRKVIEIADATKLLHQFACNEAQLILEKEKGLGRIPDPKSFEAIRVKLLWLEGKTTDQELAAAWSAAEFAARSAAWSAARSAAWSAAWSAAMSAAEFAAWSAAWSAARSAAWSAAESAARSAAWSAARSAQNERLEKMLNELF